MNAITDDTFRERWTALESKLAERFGKTPDIDAILFLIGIQETEFIKSKITKEQKQDLMHVAVCSILSRDGYYETEKIDEDGWPHFKQLKSLPEMTLTEQEDFLRKYILAYFDEKEF